MRCQNVLFLFKNKILKALTYPEVIPILPSLTPPHFLPPPIPPPQKKTTKNRKQKQKKTNTKPSICPCSGNILSLQTAKAGLSWALSTVIRCRCLPSNSNDSVSLCTTTVCIHQLIPLCESNHAVHTN